MSSLEGPTDKILVIDDNAPNRSLVQAALEDEGYDVIAAPGGLEGIAAFERWHPSCVVLDVGMPDLDGFSVCERLRRLPHGDETSVDFLTKPVHPTELVVRVQSALKMQRMSAELREHCGLLRQQRDALLRLQLHKERLMAFVVHDLKNPLYSLDLHARILQRHRWLPVDAGDSVTAIRREAKQLSVMISNLLDISRADESGLAPHASDINLRALVDEVLAELAMSAWERDVELRSVFQTDRICADRDLLQRVLINLLENAIRHSPALASVTVTARRESQGTELRVVDAGRGVAPDFREKVFQPFVQAPTATPFASDPGCRGLGLTFCKVAAEAHGGRIWVEDAGPGAAFCVWLPDAA